MQPVVLITGSSRGIGRAAALRFAKAGYHVAINSIFQIDALTSLQEEITALGGVCRAYPGDVGDYDTVKGIFSDIRKELGEVQVLVNNAGIASIGLFQDMSCDSYVQMVRTNLFSVIHCCHQAIPSMVRQHSGKIINISSVWGNAGASCEAVYSATKGGINSFTKALGKELAPSGIQVNAIACGAIDTDMNRCLSEEERASLTQQIPAGRFGQAEEVAELIFTLAQGHSYLNGQIITLDGGWV